MRNGTLRKGEPITWCRADGTQQRAKIAELFVTDALDRVPADEAGPGEIAAVAGLPDVTIGETLADAEDPRPLPVITVDEPAISVTIGINNAPLAGKDGDKVTARQIKNRLDAEIIGNVSIRVLDTERPDAWEVQGRGELQLAILVELMRREGFELTVGKPRGRHPRDRRQAARAGREPHDRRPRRVRRRRHAAARAAQGPARADGQPRHGLGPDGLPRPGARADRLPHRVPHRDARHRHAPPRLRRLGAVGGRDAPAPDRRARRRPPRRRPPRFALFNLQERGALFIEPGEEVYEGMIVGENSRADDLDVNATKEKHLTNVRSSTSDVLIRLVPPRKLSLDQALEFLREDECVEVTPHAVRLRKVELEQVARMKRARKLKTAAV